MPSSSSASHQRALLTNAATAAGKKNEDLRADLAKWKVFVEDRSGWTRLRVRVAQFIESVLYESCLFVLLLLNVALVIEETNDVASCTSSSKQDEVCFVDVTLEACNIILLALFVLESGMKVYVYRTMFWINPWNTFDFSLIMFSVLCELLGAIYPGLSALRLVRLFRLGRMLHVMVNFKPLYMIVTGFCSAIQSLFWACLLLLMATTAWSVVVVMFLHPVVVDIVASGSGVYDGCDRCAIAFSSVMNTNLTLLQTVILGDAWGDICIPVINHSPWSAVIFCGIIATIDLCICNLILATIVHSAEEARNQDTNFMALKVQACEVQQRRRLVELCEELDTDGSGTLSHEELSEGYTNNAQFAGVFQSMGLSIEDLKSVLRIADADADGFVDYLEFIDLILQIKNTDFKSMVMLMREDLSELKAKGNESVDMMLQIMTSLLPALSPDVALRAEAASSRSRNKRTQRKSGCKERHDDAPSIESISEAPLVEQSKLKDSLHKDASATLQTDTSQKDDCKAIVFENIHLESDEWEPLSSSIPRLSIAKEPKLSQLPCRADHCFLHPPTNRLSEWKDDGPCFSTATQKCEALPSQAKRRSKLIMTV